MQNYIKERTFNTLNSKYLNRYSNISEISYIKTKKSEKLCQQEIGPGLRVKDR